MPDSAPARTCRRGAGALRRLTPFDWLVLTGGLINLIVILILFGAWLAQQL